MKARPSPFAALELDCSASAAITCSALLRFNSRWRPPDEKPLLLSSVLPPSRDEELLEVVNRRGLEGIGYCRAVVLVVKIEEVVNLDSIDGGVRNAVQLEEEVGSPA